MALPTLPPPIMPPYEGNKPGSVYTTLADPYRTAQPIVPAAPVQAAVPTASTASLINANAFKTLPSQQTTVPTDLQKQADVTVGTVVSQKVGPTNVAAANVVGVPTAESDSPLVKQYQSMMSKAMSVNEGMLTGAIPEDVKKQIEQTMAEQGLSKGLYGTMTKEATVKALGLTSLDIQQKGVASTLEYAKLGESIRQYDSDSKIKIAEYNSAAKADMDKYVANLNTNTELNNAQRSDAMNQYITELGVKTKEFNTQLDAQRQQLNYTTSAQIAQANTLLRSDADKTATANYLTALNANMQANLAYDSLNKQTQLSYDAMNTKLAFDQRSLDEQKLEWEDKWDTMVRETDLKAQDSNADRALLMTELRGKMFQYSQDLIYKYFSTKAEGTSSIDATREALQKAIDAITNAGSLPTLPKTS